jgi:vancomycin permeability regulator SanA
MNHNAQHSSARGSTPAEWKAEGLQVAVGLNVVPPRDRMVNCDSGLEWEVDGRLLLRETWTKTPHLAHALLRRLAIQTPQTALSAVASRVLSIASGEFDPTKTPVQRESDFCLVLGHKPENGAHPSSELRGRLSVALDLHRQNPRMRMLLSGGGERGGVKECVVMRDWLTERGVPSPLIYLDPQSNDTVENVRFSTPILEAEGARSVVIITSAFHMLRSQALLEAFLDRKRLNWRLDCRAYSGEVHALTQEHRDNELFLLFKDMGRVLRVWEYPVLESDMGLTGHLAGTFAQPMVEVARSVCTPAQST